jgi:hypothetical protein
VCELPVSLVPPISLHPQFSQKIMLVESSPQIMRMSVTVRCNDEEQPAGGDLSVAVPPGWKSEPSVAQVNLAPADGAQSLDFKITIPAKAHQGSH